MTAFDIRTALLLLGLLYLVLPIITWMVLSGQRLPQVTLWCSAGWLAGGSFILTGLRGSVPIWMALHVGVLMLLLSFLLRSQALCLDLGRPWRRRSMAAAAATISLVFLALDLVLQNGVLRGQFVSMMWVGLSGYLATLAGRIGRLEQSRSAKWIAWMYRVLALAMLFRWYSLLGLAPDTDVNILTEGLVTKLIALTMFPISVVTDYCYMGLALERAMRREIKAAADQAREEEGHRLGLQVAQLDRQRSLGELSASLGHEFNQPLTAILTNAQVGQRGVQSARLGAEQMADIFSKIIANTQRASQIIERIRGFIRPSELRRDKVNLNRLVREMAELLATEANSRQVTFVLPDGSNEPDGPDSSDGIREVWVMGDPIQLSQIVLNVFRNAIEALSNTTRREIHVSVSSANGQALVRIQDSGGGFTPLTLAKMGTPFFTTKPTGLGMGIAISRSIAEQHGGRLTFANAAAEHGGGAVVELQLPNLDHNG